MSHVQTKVYHITYSKDFKICSLFFWGCNLRCKICLLKKEAYDCHLQENRLRIYEPDYRSARPKNFLVLESLFSLLSELEIDRTFLMGAEPLVDPALPKVLDFLKSKKNSKISLLTNGLKLSPLSLLDEIIFSLKAITPKLHKDYTGIDNRRILKNFAMISRFKGIKMYAETVFIPDYVDEREVMKIAEFIASVSRDIPFRIDAYLPIPDLPWEAPEVHQIESIAERVKDILPNTTCFYGDEGSTPLVYEIERIY